MEAAPGGRSRGGGQHRLPKRAAGCARPGGVPKDWSAFLPSPKSREAAVQQPDDWPCSGAEGAVPAYRPARGGYGGCRLAAGGDSASWKWGTLQPCRQCPAWGIGRWPRTWAGELSMDEAVERIKTATHRYARSQYAWFKLNDPSHPVAGGRRRRACGRGIAED